MSVIEHACAWHLPSDERIARRSRTRTSMVLPGMNVDDADVETATLMVSELATNAYQHAEPPYGLRIWCAAAIAVVEIFDSTQKLPSLPCMMPSSVTNSGDIVLELALMDAHGRGLPLVQHYSGGRCGADLLVSGKKTWFAVSRPWEDALSLTPTMLAIAPSLDQLTLTHTC